jgi:MFS family permease
MVAEQRAAPGVWPAAVAGLAATLIGNGLGRFAYTPLIPALIAAGWFAPAEAVYLAAANLAGYLVGAMGARRLAVATSSTFGARAAMVATVASLIACAFPLGFAWYGVWRFIAGVTGGVLMVLAVPMVLGATPGW